MAKKTTTPVVTVRELKIKLLEKRLEIRSGQEKNTNSHKVFKKQIAQLLTRSLPSHSRGGGNLSK